MFCQASMMLTSISIPAATISRSPPLRYAKSQEDFRDTLASICPEHIPKANGSPAAIGTTKTGPLPFLPTHQLIDAVTLAWPVFISRLDGHMSLANRWH